jgi:rhodanese-related sulfurtransferase
VIRIHRVLAGLALAAGLLAVFAGSPYVVKHVTALELARWIRDRKPGLRVIDLRPAADFETYHVPGAQRVPATFQPDETLVLISDGGAHAAQAWVFVRTMGHRNVYFLRGGINEWLDDVMNPNGPSQEAAALSRYFGGVPRGRDVKRPNTATAVRRRGC